MIYQKLMDDYNKLTDEEKNILLIYKSRLGRAINSLDNDYEEIKKIYNQYKALLNNPKNMFMKFTVFKDINFENEIKFIENLRNIQIELNDVITKLKIVGDMTVYRAISIPSNASLNFLSKSNIISTSINIDECFKFFIKNKGYKHYLYQINLERDSTVGICPYSILINSNEEQLLLTKSRDQKEIILSKDNYVFHQALETKTNLENGEELNIIIVDARQIKKELIEINTNKK